MATISLNEGIFATIAALAAQNQLPAYVIGGYVRDLLLQRPCTDIDIVVHGSGITLAERLAEHLGAPLTIYKNFGTAALHHEGLSIEFVGARRESYRATSRNPIVEDGSLEEDQLRRDFTINALAISLNADSYGELIDPFHGIADLNAGILRTPRNPIETYSDDPLRMMRAVRFASQLGFTINKDSEDAIRKCRRRLVGGVVARERITTELNKILLSPKPSVGFLLMDKLGLLDLVLPQVAKLKGIERRGRHQHKDVFLHTLKVVDNVAERSDNLWLRWAALLHDIAKPATKRFDDVLGFSFHGHEYFGSKYVGKIFAMLKLPSDSKYRYVKKLVLLHLRPIVLAEDAVTASAVRRLLFDAGNAIDDLMLLCEADITSKDDDKVQRYMQNLALVRQKLKDIEEKDHIRCFQPPVSGEVIMSVYGIPPSRPVGQIKEAIKEAILNGEIGNNYDEAYILMQEIATKLGLHSVLSSEHTSVDVLPSVPSSEHTFGHDL